MPSECGNVTLPWTSMQLPRPRPHIVLQKSPMPSTDSTAASG